MFNLLDKRSSAYINKIPKARAIELEEQAEGDSPTKPEDVDLKEFDLELDYEYEVYGDVIWVPIRRVLCTIVIYVGLYYTFLFTAEAGINSGIITSIFATSLIFTSIIFYFQYSQKLTGFDMLGICFVISCILVISLSGGDGSDETGET